MSATLANKVQGGFSPVNPVINSIKNMYIEYIIKEHVLTRWEHGLIGIYFLPYFRKISKTLDQIFILALYLRKARNDSWEFGQKLIVLYIIKFLYAWKLYYNVLTKRYPKIRGFLLLIFSNRIIIHNGKIFEKNKE